MMGRLNHDQRQLFYSFRLEDAVPDDHLVRAIAGVLDLSWVHAELAPYYPKLGRHSIDPVLAVETAAPLLSVKPFDAAVHNADEMEHVIEQFARESDSALLVLP